MKNVCCSIYDMKIFVDKDCNNEATFQSHVRAEEIISALKLLSQKRDISILSFEKPSSVFPCLWENNISNVAPF